MTTAEKLFANEEEARTVRTLRFKIIRPVFETLTIKEHIPEYINPKTRITQPETVWEMFRFLGRESKEWFIALHVDGKNKIIAVDAVSIGSLNQSIVHPREVFKTALLSSATAIILLHNHPSGDTTPSQEDITITRRLKEASEILGVKILDHIIVSDSEFTSFVNRGII